MSHHCWVVVFPGFINGEDSLLSDGAFYQGVSEDNFYLLILDEGATLAFVYGLWLPLHYNLRG